MCIQGMAQKYLLQCLPRRDYVLDGEIPHTITRSRVKNSPWDAEDGVLGTKENYPHFLHLKFNVKGKNATRLSPWRLKD